MLAQKVAVQASTDCILTALDLPEFDLTDQAQVDDEVSRIHPDWIVNCAAFTNVDACETQEDLATRVNGSALVGLAAAAKKVDATLVHISTDYVFPGTGETPLTEEDPVAPQSAYGRSKLAGEQAILLGELDKFLIVRTSWLYGPGGKNFVETIIRLAKEREEIGVVADQLGSPTYTGDLAHAIYNLLSFSPPSFGLYHFSNEGMCSWYDFAVEIIDQARRGGEVLKVRKVKPIRTQDYPLPAKRPAYSVLSKQKYRETTGLAVPHWQEGLKKYFQERKLS